MAWLEVAALITVLVLFIDLWAIVNIAAAPVPVRVRGAWSAAVILLPVLGWAAWRAAGPGRPQRRSQRRP